MQQEKYSWSTSLRVKAFKKKYLKNEWSLKSKPFIKSVSSQLQITCCLLNLWKILLNLRITTSKTHLIHKANGNFFTISRRFQRLNSEISTDEFMSLKTCAERPPISWFRTIRITFLNILKSHLKPRANAYHHHFFSLNIINILLNLGS